MLFYGKENLFGCCEMLSDALKAILLSVLIKLQVLNSQK